jgi:hypothetical protein
MLLLRRVGPQLVLFLFVTGCAAMQDTLAQDLAWQRVEKCKGIGSSLQVTRVDPDGRIWYQTVGGTGGASEFVNCLQKAAADQAGGPVVPSPVMSTVSSPSGAR